MPVETRVKIIRFASATFAAALATTVILGFFGYMATVAVGVPPAARIGLGFATVSLFVGSLFFAYSMKYYLTLAIVLSFSRQPLEEGGGYAVGLGAKLNNNHKNSNGNGNGGWLRRIFGLNGNGNGNGNGKNDYIQAGGLQPSLDHIKLKRYPFVSIHLPFYNEKKVAERILEACTSMDYPSTRDTRSGQVLSNYEVIVCDDSTDETVQIVQKYAKEHNRENPHGPKIKILHRSNREGFKGGALKYAVENMDPRTEFCVVFDADFIPYPDTLEMFVKYFKVNNNGSENYQRNNIAAVGGYQWHVLNKSENWITRGVRTEYAGSYVIERPGGEILGLLKQISGSVYMIRSDVLKKVGWGTSITEDFQLTLKLYEQGYKVVYTPYVQAPSECVSTLKRLIRQRMRWSEGHSHCIRQMFVRLMKSPKLTFLEKLEVLYISPYYLQAAFFLVGTFCWLLAETVFRARLPFWTSLWGWSLVLTNFFALPLVNAVGLFLEESEEKDYLGILSFVALSYIMVPFQAYASIKGFLEKEEGTWFRTPKSGKITDIFTRGKFYRWVAGILPGRRGVPAVAAVQADECYAWLNNPHVALATANNQFNDFKIKPKRLRWVAKLALVILLVISVSLYHLSFNVSETYAAMNQATQWLSKTASTEITAVTAWRLEESLPSTDCVVGTDCPGIAKNTIADYQYEPGVTANATGGTIGTPTGKGWLIDGDAAGVAIAAGTWTFKVCIDADDTDGDSVGYGRGIAWKVTTSGGSITSSTQIADTTTSGSAQDWWVDDYYTITDSAGSAVTFDAENHLYVEIWNIKTAKGDIGDLSTIRITGDEFATCGTGNDTQVISPTVTVPEFVLAFIFLIPFIPGLVRKFKLKLVARR